MSPFQKPDEEEWRTLIAAFKMYKAAYGDLKVPSRFVVPAMPPWPESGWGLKLGQRVAAIRSTGKYVQEDEGRRKVLDDIGFLWRLRAPSPDKKMDGITFDQIYDALATYRKEVQPGKTTLNIPANFVVPNCEPWPESTRGLPLGKKIPTIRSKAYLKANPEAHEKLAKLGFEFDGKVAANDARYNKVYIALVRYKEINGDLLVPQPYVVPENSDEWPEETWGLRLGARVNAIRSQGTFVKTNPDRRKQLDELGFVWEPPKSAKGARRGRKKKEENKSLQGPAPPGILEGGLLGRKDDLGGSTSAEMPGDGVPSTTGGSAAAMKSIFGPSSAFGGEDPFNLGKGPEKASPTWDYEGDDAEATSEAEALAQRAAEDVYKPPKDLATSLRQAKEMAESVGIIEVVTEENDRTRKGKIAKQIPWFNDDFGGDFVFEDVVEALTLYKSFCGDFDNLDDEFVVPEPAGPIFGLDGSLNSAGIDVEASASAAAAIAAAERDGAAESEDLISAEIQRMEMELQSPGSSREDTLDELHEDDVKSEHQWPEHLSGMMLGSIVKRIRDGSLEVKHLPERKAQLDAIGFDWGDPKLFLDVPFDKATCAMYAYYLIRGDMFVYEDFVMLDEDPWPKALAGYELGKAVKRIRELQNFLEAYHPEKMLFLRMVEFIWFPMLALPLDPDAPEQTDEELYYESVGHPFYHINMPPVGTTEEILSEGPWGKDPNKYSSWYNWDVVKDYWYEEGIQDPAAYLRYLGFPKLADDHEEKYGKSTIKQLEDLDEKVKEYEDMSDEEYNALLEPIVENMVNELEEFGHLDRVMDDDAASIANFEEDFDYEYAMLGDIEQGGFAESLAEDVTNVADESANDSEEGFDIVEEEIS